VLFDLPWAVVIAISTRNRSSRTVKVSPETPPSLVVGSVLGLTGTEFGCGKALCSACAVQMI
jgi:isoquinoline 1-oxidoreductase subunit alpha